MAIPSSVLKGSVGFGGRNERKDVQLVQTLLNAVPAAKGGAFPALTQDGLCGPMTSGAIRQFQTRNQCYADGRIDAAGKTEQTLLALLDQLGKLAGLLGSGGGATPAPVLPAVAGPNSPVRRRYVQTARSLVPASGLTQGGSAPAVEPGKPKPTGCGEFPGRVFAKLPVIPPGQPGAFKVQVAGAGTMYLTTPTTWWEQLAQSVDKQYQPARNSWVPFTGGNRPMPGDVYLLAQYDKPRQFQHVGVIIDASGSEWTTCDGGQGGGWQSGLVKRQFEPDGVITGEFGNKARLKGWVDLDNLYAVARPSFPVL